MTNVLIIGANSAIATAYARLQASRGHGLALVGRDAAKLTASADDLRVRGTGPVWTRVLDVADLASHEAMLDEAWTAIGRVDVVLIAHGTLPDQERATAETAYAIHEFNVNAVATIALLNALAIRMQRQGSGVIAVISSVAGDRGRASNYLYGSAKAAVTEFASGLRQRLAPAGIHVVTIKPGFVDTPMTRSFKKGALWATPEAVASGIDRAIRQRKPVAYLPSFWWAIMRIIRAIPERVFVRVKL